MFITGHVHGVTDTNIALFLSAAVGVLPCLHYHASYVMRNSISHDKTFFQLDLFVKSNAIIGRIALFAGS